MSEIVSPAVEELGKPTFLIVEGHALIHSNRENALPVERVRELAGVSGLASNPSIERTCQRLLRTLCPAAHVKR